MVEGSVQINLVGGDGKRHGRQRFSLTGPRHALARLRQKLRAMALTA